MKKEKENGVFPTFALVILLIGVFWLLNDLNVLKVNVPWIPIVIIVVAIGWIVDHFAKK
jgi:hypothetical protein